MVLQHSLVFPRHCLLHMCCQWVVIASPLSQCPCHYSGAIGDEKHMIFDCAAIAPLRQQHADLFTPRTDTMRSFFASGGFELRYRLSEFHEHMTVLP